MARANIYHFVIAIWDENQNQIIRREKRANETEKTLKINLIDAQRISATFKILAQLLH